MILSFADPKVSICCITYNHKKYIGEALAGFLSQKTSFSFEILIHDDASTDGTENIIREYEEKYPGLIKPIYEKENQWSKGIRGSSQFNFPRARGKYIALCEGDDHWTSPNKLQKQVDFLESNPEYGLVHSDLNQWYEKSNTIIEKYNAFHHITIPEGDIFHELLDPRKYIIKTPTVLFRKELLEQYVDFNIVRANGWSISDLFLWLSIAKFSKIKYIPEALAIYRVLKESASNTENFKKKIRIHISAYEIRLYFAKKFYCSEMILNQIKTNHVNTIIFDAFRISDKKLSNEIMKFARDNNIIPNFKSRLLFYGTQNIILNKLLNQLW